MAFAPLQPRPINVCGTLKFQPNAWPTFVESKFAAGQKVHSTWEKDLILYTCKKVSINEAGLMTLTIVSIAQKPVVKKADNLDAPSPQEYLRTPESATHVNLTVDISSIVRDKVVQVYPDHVRFIGESGPETVYFRDMGYGAAAAARKAFLEGNSGYRATMISYTVKDLGLKKLCLPDPTIEP